MRTYRALDRLVIHPTPGSSIVVERGGIFLAEPGMIWIQFDSAMNAFVPDGWRPGYGAWGAHMAFHRGTVGFLIVGFEGNPRRPAWKIDRVARALDGGE